MERMNRWSREDLPSVIKSHSYSGIHFSRLQQLDEYADGVVEHLNKHHPKLEFAYGGVVQEPRHMRVRNGMFEWVTFSRVENERAQALKEAERAAANANLWMDQATAHKEFADEMEKSRDVWRARAGLAEDRVRELEDRTARASKTLRGGDE